MIYKNRVISIPDQKNLFLFGIRGSGKTECLKRRFSKALYIDLLNESRYQNYLSKVGQFYEDVNAFKDDGLVIVDEIQRMPQLLNEVHRLISSSHRRFILTGSSTRKINAKNFNLLGGRAGKTLLYPFVPEELGEDFNLNQALRYGLIPIIWSADDRNDKLKDYTETYLKEDIKAEALVRSLPNFARFLEVAGLCHGQAVNISSIASTAEISRHSVRDFFSILEDTYLGFFIPAYSSKLKIKEKKTRKFYLIDPGLARAFKGHFGPVTVEEKGFLFEGLIAQILIAYGDYCQLYESLYYWSPAEAKVTEVDFLLKRGDELMAVEAKAKEQVSSQDCKGLRAIKKLNQSNKASIGPKVTKRIVVYMGKVIRKTEDGIDIWPFDFFCENLKENFETDVISHGQKKPFRPKPLEMENLFLEPSRALAHEEKTENYKGMNWSTINKRSFEQTVDDESSFSGNQTVEQEFLENKNTKKDNDENKK